MFSLQSRGWSNEKGRPFRTAPSHHRPFPLIYVSVAPASLDHLMQLGNREERQIELLAGAVDIGLKHGK
jgi:hypothetical protein